MADVKQLTINGISYSIKDATARQLIETLQGDFASVVTGGKYDSSAKEIQLTHGETVLAHIDATDFIKDGMVDDVKVEGGKLVITFNTDSGKEDIEIEVSKIFDASNYYNKTEADGKFATKSEMEVVSGDLEDALGEIATLEADKADKSELTKYETVEAHNADKATLEGEIAKKQDTLVSGTNIKTVNGQSVLGSGDIAINTGFYTIVDSYQANEENAAVYQALKANKGGTVSVKFSYSGTHTLTTSSYWVDDREVITLTGIETETYSGFDVWVIKLNSDGSTSYSYISSQALVDTSKLQTKVQAAKDLEEAKQYADGKVEGLASETFVSTSISQALAAVASYDDASETLTLTFA